MAKKYYNEGSEKKANPGAPDGVYSMAHAGMPTEKVMKEYPMGGYGFEGNYDDTVQGIDMFGKMNHKKMMSQIRKLSDS